MISLKEAQALVLDHSSTLETELISFTETLGRITATPIIAAMDVPPFNRSPLDGYALRAEDTFGASPEHPAALDILTETKNRNQRVNGGTCVRIYTGDPIPFGADTVVPQEKVTRLGNVLYLATPYRPGSNFACAGEDITRGTTVLDTGTLIESVHLGILASLGLHEINVFRKPVAAVLSTGYELRHPGSQLTFGQIYDCNTHMLCALISECASIPVPLGIVNDNTETLSYAMEKALAEHDLVITTGGVSVGDQDLIGNALENIDAHILFWRVAIKPGTPVLAAHKKGKLIFCLPGNPAAAYITFEQLVRPSLFEMSGYKKWQRPEITAYLEHNIPAAGSQNRFIRAICSLNGTSFTVRRAGLERSGVLSTFKDANALIYLPAGTPLLEEGKKVTVQLLSLPQGQGISVPSFS